MKGLYIKDLKKGDSVESFFLLQEKRIFNYREKLGSFLWLTLSDKSGQLPAKKWDVNPVDYEAYKEKDIIWVRGEITEYQESLEVSIVEMKFAEEKNIDFSDFLPVSPCEHAQMEKELLELISSIDDLYLRKLLDNLMAHPIYGPLYKVAPAAKMQHQAYLYGLLEHSLQTAKIVKAVGQFYPNINLDLALTGALIHDIGKVKEYEYKRGIDISDEGRLLGHIVLGLQILEELIEVIPNFPEQLRLDLLHIITSHHGKYEWQSPKRPKTIEACLIHYADALEADLWKFQDAENKFQGQSWTPWLKNLERYIYLGKVE